MTLQSVRKIFLSLVLLAFFLAGVWIVVTNAQHQVTLNLLFVEFTKASVGVITLLSFAAGALGGIITSLIAFRVLPMHLQIRRSRRELDLLRQQQSRAPGGD